MQSRRFSAKANRQDAAGLERNLLGRRSDKRKQYFLGSVAVIIILSSLSATIYPSMMEKARQQQILDSTLTISIAAQELVREPVEVEEALPIPNDEYRSIATASQYVIADGLGTLVADWNGTYIVTHDHWSLLDRESGLVQLGNASGEQVLEIELATLKNLIRYRDGGTLVFDAPAELASTDNLTPAMISTTGSQELEYGDPFLLAHRQRDGRGGVSIMKVSLERTGYKLGQPTIRLQTPDGQSIIGGDSGGGVWLKGKLVGNMWTTIMMENKISSERRSTNSAIAAIYPLP
jgi:hypothetical protein